MRTSVLSLLVVAALALPAAARGDMLSFTVEAYGGYSKLHALDLERGVGGLSDGSLLKRHNIPGGLAGLLKIGFWEFGALVENDWNEGSRMSTAAGLVGLGLDLFGFRLEGLAEVGGQRLGSYLDDSSVTNPPSGSWLPYAGLRPGLSYRFGTLPKLMVGVWGFARWDVPSKEVTVTTPAGSHTYKLGGSSYGASLRVGLSF